MVCLRGESLTTHKNQMTAFRTATNTIGGVAFGLLIVCVTPAITIGTLAMGAVGITFTYQAVTEPWNGLSRSENIKGAIFSYLIFIAACFGDWAFIKFLMKLNKDSRDSKIRIEATIK